VPVEKDEVSFACLVDHLVDPNQSLDRCPAAAFVDRIEIHDADDLPLGRHLCLEWPATYAAISGLLVILAPW
jgi:hypothetical protein